MPKQPPRPQSASAAMRPQSQASSTPSSSFVYDLPRLLRLLELESRLLKQAEPTLHVLHPLPEAGRIAVLAGSFNPLTRAHEALVAAALSGGTGAALLLLPVRAVDKEGVTRAALPDRALVAMQWAARYGRAGVAIANRGLYVEQAALLAGAFPGRAIAFVVGHDKVLQIFDPRYYEDRDDALRALFARAGLLVAPRLGQGEAALRSLLECEQNRAFARHVMPLSLPADVDALSSTAVREAARHGGDWEPLVPAETAEFMREALPYSPPARLCDGEEIDAYRLRLALLAAAAAGRLDTGADVAALCHETRAATPEGRHLRAWLGYTG